MKKTASHRLRALYPLSLVLLLVFNSVGKAADIIPEHNNTLIALADTAMPSDVENVKTKPEDGAVTLTWDVSTDNVGVKGYKLYYGPSSVNTNGGSYTKGPIDVGNKISYKVSGLTNGQKYFFALTAYDAAGNESENYSVETTATPAHAAADNEAPKVAKAEALNKVQVRVIFSEPIQLPAKSPESAISIKNDGSSAVLEVKAVSMDITDPTNKSILLATAAQQAGASYILTAGITLKDTSGNPIVSGTSDTASFTGTDIEPSKVSDTQQAKTIPELKSVESTDSTHVEVVFSEPVVLKADGRENFIITEEQNIENTLDIQKVELSETKTRVTLTTTPQKAMKYNLIAIDVANSTGGMISPESNATTFMGAVSGTLQPSTSEQTQQNSSATDTTPPEDATDLVAAMMKQLILTLSWKSSPNTAGDLVNYVLYMSTDGKNYEDGVPIDPTSTNFDVKDLIPQVKYFFKLVARDKAGNESQGIVTTFKLASTGPELGLVFIGSMALGKILKRKNRKSKK